MMAGADPVERLAGVVRASGLVAPGSSGIALLSGGPDSACLAAALASVCSSAGVEGLHLNYGLRETADRDERCCRDLCAQLRMNLHIERQAPLGPGNLQAAARDARYAAAEQIRDRLDADWIATGHTRTDVAETVIYRLASSPGRRALLGLPARRGRVIRPLLALGRREARSLAISARLPFADDPTNVDPAFARNRIRLEVLPVLEAINPGVEQNIAETRAALAEEQDLVEHLAEEALAEGGAAGGATAVQAAALADVHPALRRLALQLLIERAAGVATALSRARAAEIWRLANDPEGGTVELGRGLSVVCEHGLVRVERPSAAAPPKPVTLSLPGVARFGSWELEAELRPGPGRPAGPEVATLDADSLGGELVVRCWEHGDRMRPLGLGGTKTLQDLFTDRRVPRSLRRTLPVFTSDGEIAWVAGVAVGEDFRLRGGTRTVALLRARSLE